MRIESAVINGEGKLVLDVSPQDAKPFVYRFKSGDYDIVKHKNKRSLDANAYCWTLVNKIAEALNLPPITVYQNALHDIGNAMEIVCVQDKAVESMERLWVGEHIGRRTERLKSKTKGCTNLMLFYGSSDFDTKQMSMLIDNLVQDCKAMGIETRPQEEINALLEEWNG